MLALAFVLILVLVARPARTAADHTAASLEPEHDHAA
jgi:hypothetical protein